MLKTPLKFLITIILTLGLSMSFQSLLASWTAPTAPPPTPNVPEPINRGLGYQDKLGSLGIGSNLGVGGRQILGGEASIVPGIKSYLEFDSGNDFSVAKGESSRIYRDTTGDFTGNTNNDFLVFEKTDGNDLTPDGGILFVNRNMNNDRELAVAIRGNGNVGIGTVNPTDAKLHVEGTIRASIPTEDYHVATKEYVDNSTQTLPYVCIAGCSSWGWIISHGSYAARLSNIDITGTQTGGVCRYVDKWQHTTPARWYCGTL